MISILVEMMELLMLSLLLLYLMARKLLLFMAYMMILLFIFRIISFNLVTGIPFCSWNVSIALASTDKKKTNVSVTSMYQKKTICLSAKFGHGRI